MLLSRAQVSAPTPAPVPSRPTQPTSPPPVGSLNVTPEGRGKDGQMGGGNGGSEVPARVAETASSSAAVHSPLASAPIARLGVGGAGAD